MPDNKKKKGHIPPMHLEFLTPIYDLSCALMGLGRRFRAAVIEKAGIAGSERVLDAGCGTGALLVALKERYPDVSADGLDPDEAALGIARKKSVGKGVNIGWHLGFMEEMQFADGSFDIVLSTLAFHHVDPEKKVPALRECLRVLRPGGRMVLADVMPDDTGLLGSLVFRVLSIFEYLMKSGEVMDLMKKAGFSEVREIGGYRFGITFIEGRK